ncbi:oxidoreductase [Lophiotrema nucula]|uniref:Oxidoreductase n=1 Tax=Lophiotrema nucula TaxID=690887 RepID=A0A6A5Z4C0_9PLEO|nr:oxidoreductase [Lophiotrema nucula]
MATALKSAARLAGKVAIITGGGSGYGAGIALRFAREGAKVIVADINEDGGRKTASASPDNMSFFKTNVTQASDWQKLLDTAESRYGPVTTLINNAGTSYRNKPTADVTESDFERCFDVNVKGVFYGSQAFLARAVKSGKEGGCSMVNIASVGATRPRPGLVWYNASKGAVWNVTKGLAAEYGPLGVRVNSVCPLLGGTGLFEAFSGVPDTPENRAKFVSNVPLGRLCEADDVANACLFLASDEAKFVTGINLEVDGGRAV